MDKTIYDLNETRDNPPDSQHFETLACDTEKYRKYLEGFDLSEEEQAEVLEILWKIMAAFVDMGFGVDSIHFLPKEDETPPDQKMSSLAGPQGGEGDST